MSEEVDTRVSLSLHPFNVTKLDGFDENTSPYLAASQTAFSEAYVGIGNVHTVREKAKTHPGWSEVQQIIETQDYADKIFARVARSFDAAAGNLDRSIAALEEQLTSPVAAKAANAVSAEIRAYVRALDTAQRMTFMQRALDGGDQTSLSAVLGAPGYLSGLDQKTVEVFTRLHHERATPEVAKRVRAMKAARDLIGERSGLVHVELERAVGHSAAKVHALRRAKNEAERAFVLKEA